MKRIYIISILTVICSLTAMAQEPDKAHKTTGRDRQCEPCEVTLVFDKNKNVIEVYSYDSDYYDVTFTPSTSQDVVIECRIIGEHNLIDVSNLSSGTYIIILTSSHGNTYRWTFEHSFFQEILRREDTLNENIEQNLNARIE